MQTLGATSSHSSFLPKQSYDTAIRQKQRSRWKEHSALYTCHRSSELHDDWILSKTIYTLVSCVSSPTFTQLCSKHARTPNNSYLFYFDNFQASTPGIKMYKKVTPTRNNNVFHHPTRHVCGRLKDKDKGNSSAILRVVKTMYCERTAGRRSHTMPSRLQR